MSKVITAEQAAELIKDGDIVGASVMGLAGWPEEVAIAVEERFLKTGHPRDLTFVHSCTCGDHKSKGATHFAHEGMVKRLICGHTGASNEMASLVEQNKIECYLLPQGVICQLWRAIASRKPGVITKVGLGTYVDPRLQGGKISPRTKEDIVHLIELDGEEWLFYKKFPINVALIRGTYADEHGNLTMEKEMGILEALYLAMAAKNSGGIVIAQVLGVAKAHTFNPKNVRVPGVLVDYIVIAKPENHMQTEVTLYNPALSGEIKAPLEQIPSLPLDARKIIARRAAMELAPNTVINLGIGIPAGVASVAAEEGVIDQVTMTTELGNFGGVPAYGGDFGGSYNSEATIDHASMFDFYDGGGLDATFLGLAQVDRFGNVNVSKFGKRVIGPGGFINISQNAKKIVFCGTFVNGAEIAVENGRLKILKEGEHKKFVNEVEQVTFSGNYARSTKVPVLYVTERCVFSLEPEGLTLIEIAPGIDLEKDILAMMEFTPRISPNLKTMDEAIFREKWGMLKKIMEDKVR